LQRTGGTELLYHLAMI